MSCRDKETHNNYFVPIGSFFADFCLKEAIRQRAKIVVPVDHQDNSTEIDKNDQRIEMEIGKN